MGGSWQRLQGLHLRDRMLPGFRQVYSSAWGVLTRRSTVTAAVFVGIGLVIVMSAPSLIWMGVVLGAAGAALALFLQQLVDPTPLFWTVPWEAMQLVVNRQVRLNHFWLHRTQGLIHDSDWPRARLDGFATREGFFLTGIGPNNMEAQWNAELAWRGLTHHYATRSSMKGCKTARFLLTLWLLAGGLLTLAAWRGFDLPGALLVAAICGAAGDGFAGPVERMLGRWVAGVARREEEARPYRIEVEQAELPELPWSKAARGFWVRRLGPERCKLGDIT